MYYQTTDGNLFYTEDAAINHARTLSDRKVIEVNNVTINSFQTKAREATAETQVALIPEPIANLNDLSKKDLLEMAAQQGITVAPKATKQEIIEALQKDSNS